MTVAVILAGLVPIVWGSGTGSEVMSRIAAPMLGGHDHRALVVFAGGACCLCLVAAANPYPAGLDLGDAAFSNQRCVERDVGLDAIAKCLRR